MKRIYLSIVAVASVVGFLLFTACDWSSGSQQGFNTSGGSSNVNISGVYQGRDGARAVSRTSNGNVTFLTIQQSGNRVDVTDNQGSTYVGSIGSPLYSGNPANNVIPAGATFSSYQISFSGKDGVAARDVNFTGTIGLVSTRIIEGTINGNQTATASSSSSSTLIPVSSTSTEGSNGNVYGVTYVIAEQNTQLRLQGTWVEIGGVVSGVDAIAEGVAGSIEFSAPAPEIPDPVTPPVLPTPIPPAPTPTPVP